MDGGEYLKVKLQHRVEQETLVGWIQAGNVQQEQALGEVGPLRASGAFASAFNVCSDRERTASSSCQPGIHPHPCHSSFQQACTGSSSVWLLGCLMPSHKPSPASYIHAGLESAHKQSWIQLPRKEVAWDIRDLPLAAAGSRQRVSNPLEKPCGASAATSTVHPQNDIS